MGGARRGATPVWGLLALVAALWPAMPHAGAAASVVDVSDEFLYQQHRSEDGLPQNSITAITQSPDGYLWLGTFNGVARFDGVRFVVFDGENSPGLPGNRIVSAECDRRGVLWVATEFGDLAALKGGVFTNLSAVAGRVSGLRIDERGEVWIEYPAALSNTVSGVVVETQPKALEMGRTFDLVVGAQGEAWVARKHGLVHARAGAKPEGSPTFFGLADLPFSMARSGDGGMWAISREGVLAKAHPGRGVESSEPVPHPEFQGRAVYEDREGNVWVGGASGVILRRAKGGRWESFGRTPCVGKSIRLFYEDRFGNFWVGTDGAGLVQIKPRAVATLGEGVALAVGAGGEGGVWVSFSREPGVEKWDWGTRRRAPHQPFTQYGYVWAVLADEESGLWMEAGGGGLMRVSESGGPAFLFPESSHLRQLRVLHRDRSGAVWAGYYAALARIKDGRMSILGPEAGMPAASIRAVAEGPDGTIWVGTQEGLVKIEGNQARVFKTRDGLPTDDIWSLLCDEDGTLWVGTFGRGLSRWRDGQFLNYGEALPTRVVTCIVEDHLGFLWLGSMKGIARVGKRELHAFSGGAGEVVRHRLIDQRDGMASAECSGGFQPSAFRAPDGKIWIPTIEGVAVVDPDKMDVRTQAPKAFVEEALVDKRPLDLGSGGILVPAGAGRLDIRFTAIEFAAPNNVRIRYRMEGLEKGWNDARAERTATYLQLPPGEYRFKVAAAHADGLWEEPGAEIGVVVEPHYWQTGWFQLGVGLLVAAAAWQGFRLRVQRLEEVGRLRMRIAGDLHDEIGANLGSIGLSLDMLGQEQGLSTSQRGEISEISGVAMQTGQALRDIVWFTNPDFDNVAGMVRRMREVARMMLAGRKHSFVATPENGARGLSLEFRRNFFLIYKELLHNIARHSQAAEVWITLEATREEATLVVVDNGRGFDPLAVEPGAGSGNGLRNVGRRATELGGSVEFSFPASGGVCVTVKAPLAKRGGRPGIGGGLGGGRGPA